MARPSEYNFEMCKDICKEIANGANIKAVLASQKEYPDFSTWCRWKREHDELYNLYTKSIQDKADSVDAQMDEIWEGCRLGNYDPSTARVLIDTLKWKAAKYYPKMYGDKVQQEHSGEVTTNIISLGNGIKPDEVNK